jgi:large subunit ribosomal protein L31
MKKNLHPKSSPVVFKDAMTGEAFLIESTAASAETILWEDGKTYPLVTVEITSRSHPVFTGQERDETKNSRAQSFKQKYEKPSVH